MMIKTLTLRRDYFKLIRVAVVGLGIVVTGCSSPPGTGASIGASGISAIPEPNQAAAAQTTETNASSTGMQNAAIRSQAVIGSTSNGVYAYGRGAFPTNTFKASNYWVDVVFHQTSGDAGANLFAATSVPSTVAENDPQAVELGVQFRSAAAGTITGIRFYKSSKNTGTHVGNLWSVTGKRLATATFSGETSSGWQQVNFTTPVALAAGTTYIASYHTSVGYYSANSNYFTHCRSNGQLTALGASPCIVPSPAPSPSAIPSASPSPSATPSPKPSPTATAKASPTPPPSPTPIPTPTRSSGGDLASTLCVGGSKYTLDDHDWFDKDSTLSVSDTWPESGGAEWSNQFSWGRANNVGTDLSWYPSRAEVSAAGLPPVASIVPGVGVSLKAIPEPASIANAPGNQDSYYSGLLSNSKAYTNGYWVFSAQLAGGNGWWPAVWLLSENGGSYSELDNEEQWGPGVLGSNVVAQTEQGSPTLSKRTTIATSDSAQHSYGAIATPNYVGFYIDGAPTTKQYARYSMSALNPIMNMQVCSNSSYCGPAPAAGQTGQMTVKYYAHYSPPAAPAPCSPSEVATPAP